MAPGSSAEALPALKLLGLIAWQVPMTEHSGWNPVWCSVGFLAAAVLSAVVVPAMDLCPQVWPSRLLSLSALAWVGRNLSYGTCGTTPSSGCSPNWAWTAAGCSGPASRQRSWRLSLRTSSSSGPCCDVIGSACASWCWLSLRRVDEPCGRAFKRGPAVATGLWASAGSGTLVRVSRRAVSRSALGGRPCRTSSGSTPSSRRSSTCRPGVRTHPVRPARPSWRQRKGCSRHAHAGRR